MNIYAVVILLIVGSGAIVTGIAAEKELVLKTKVVCCVLCSIFFLIVIWVVAVLVISANEKSVYSYLMPDNIPTPENNCPNKDGFFTVLFGNETYILPKQSQNILISDSKENLVVAKNVNLQLAIDAVIYDINGKKIVEIKENDGTVKTDSNHSATFTPYVLDVRDSKGKKILYIRYLNPNTIKLLGDFYTKRKHIFI